MNKPDRSATKTKQVIIIPVNPHGLRTSLFTYQRTRPLLLLLSLLAILALLHMFASANLPPSQATNCYSLLHTTNYSNLLHLHAPDQQLGAISYQERLIPGRPVALVPTIHSGQPATQDLTVYSCSMHGQTPGLLYITRWPNLVNPNIGISKTGTLLIGNQEGSPLPRQVYHEYSWQRTAFVEIVFPGLYPVLSRAEAEQLQKQSSAQDGLPWHDPRSTAEQLALQVFGWSRTDFEANIQTQDVTSAQVSLLHRNPVINVLVTLQQLITTGSDGLWFVTGAQTPGLQLRQPGPFSTVQSPLQLEGSGIQAKGQLTLTLLDNNFQPIRDTTPASLTIDAGKHFAGILTFPASSAHQPGLLLIHSPGSLKPLQPGQLLLTKLLLK